MAHGLAWAPAARGALSAATLIVDGAWLTYWFVVGNVQLVDIP